MARRCIICRDSYEDQFISNYETLDHEKQIISVCEFCFDEHSEYDNEKDSQYIYFGQDFYPVGLL